jgi:hypothetical protein
MRTFHFIKPIITRGLLTQDGVARNDHSTWNVGAKSTHVHKAYRVLLQITMMDVKDNTTRIDNRRQASPQRSRNIWENYFTFEI